MPFLDDVAPPVAISTGRLLFRASHLLLWPFRVQVTDVVLVPMVLVQMMTSAICGLPVTPAALADEKGNAREAHSHRLV